MFRRLLVLASFLFALSIQQAHAQSNTTMWCWNNAQSAPCTVANPLAISGSLSIAGTTSNASSGVATSSTNLPTVGYLYGFNGATWDQLQVNGSKALQTNDAAAITALNSIVTNTGASIPAGTANIGNVGQISQYPSGATAITASATGTTGATTATLAGTNGKTTYICGYSIRANATAATTVTNTITGTVTATLSSIMWVAPAASGIGVDEMVFSPCIPASATNTGIAIVSGAPGSGGNVSSKGWGYQL